MTDEPLLPDIRVFPTVPALATAAADLFVELCGQAISHNGVFSIGLSGGSTPKALFELLAKEPYASRVDWPSVDVYFVDERCVPPDHADSNYRMAKEALLSKVPLRPHAVHRMKGELDPEAAAKEYGLLLQQKFDDGGLDLCLLGMGDDGHTASLFPGTAAVNEARHRVVANYAENSTTGKSWRITMTAPFINRSAVAAIMVAGAGKAPTVARVLEGEPDPVKFPIQLIRPDGGKLIWMLDAAAAGMNEA
ncbi:MAG TPA: 6-phosphogluconolactonase [Tepidisphaeraceae bacterium]|nr:6-phosphogluconolactonase [Tepidisphaeraceae bacterium]